MLILSRKIEEAIFIGANAEIKIYILGIQGRNVRIGVTASKDIPVHREEIYERIQAEKEEGFERSQIETEADEGGNK